MLIKRQADGEGTEDRRLGSNADPVSGTQVPSGGQAPRKTVFRYRVKSLCGLLNRQADSVNDVWNYCNETQRTAVRRGNKWLTGFDLNLLTVGTANDLSLHSGTVNAVCEQYAKSRRQHKRPWLRWRGRKSLGWVPVKGRNLCADDVDFIFHSNRFRVFNSRRIPEGVKILDGTNFARDRRGNWFLNVVVELPASQPQRTGQGAVGIDLGLKDLAVLSTGEKIGNPRHYARLCAKLAVAQRARKERQAKKLHARIANARSDHLHKESTRIVERFSYIAVGNVSPSRLAKTGMGKSVIDAAWSSFRRMLSYKAIGHGASYEEVDEVCTTQICSSCGSRTGPVGPKDLGIRRWVCAVCGVEHDRDVNSALNILARSGHRAPAEGIHPL